MDIETYEVEDNLSERRVILGRMALACCLAVLAEADIEPPVGTIFGAPMGTHSQLDPKRGAVASHHFRITGLRLADFNELPTTFVCPRCRRSSSSIATCLALRRGR